MSFLVWVELPHWTLEWIGSSNRTIVTSWARSPTSSRSDQILCLRVRDECLFDAVVPCITFSRRLILPSTQTVVAWRAFETVLLLGCVSGGIVEADLAFGRYLGTCLTPATSWTLGVIVACPEVRTVEAFFAGEALGTPPLVIILARRTSCLCGGSYFNLRFFSFFNLRYCRIVAWCRGVLGRHSRSFFTIIARITRGRRLGIGLTCTV